jgi:hypothetical protein
VKLALDQRNLSGQNVAVNVIEEVQPDEQQQCAQSGVDAAAGWRMNWLQGVGSRGSSARYHEYHSRRWETDAARNSWRVNSPLPLWYVDVN